MYLSIFLIVALITYLLAFKSIGQIYAISTALAYFYLGLFLEFNGYGYFIGFIICIAISMIRMIMKLLEVRQWTRKAK